jgi:ubiquinone biosynthesis protein Coq4
MKLITEILPWVYRNSSKCEDLMSFKYEEYFHHPISDVRQLLNITKAPTI